MKTNKILMSAFALTVAFASLTSCGKDDPAAPLPQIGGYDNAGQVGKADLVAYWSMDGNGKESISGTAPENSVGATFVAGAKGQAASFVNGFMAYPSITALASTTGSITISTWAKVSNNKTDTSASPSCLLTLSRPNDWAGNVNLLLETGQRDTANDSIQVKGYVQIKKSDGTNSGQDIVNMIKQEPWMDSAHSWNANKVGGQWAHYAIVWNATDGSFKIYVNGVKISNTAWESRNGGSALPLNFFTPTKPIIGAFSTFADGTTTDTWNKPLTGLVDEMRVWKKALTVADINALYELEKAGR